MDETLRFLLPLLLVVVGLVLLLGLWNMLRGGSPGRSQALMRWRVALQLIAVAIVMAILYFSR